MNAIHTDAGQGWNWVVEGWLLFAKSPGNWIAITLIYLIISIVLSYIPFVGGLVHALITPVLVGGMLYGAATQANGGRLEIAHLFRGFQDQDRIGPLIVLGAMTIGAYLIMGLVILIFMGGTLATGLVMDSTGMNVTPQTLTSLLTGAGLIALLVVLVLGLAIGMGLFYGIPLVMLAGQNPWPAVQDSVAACWINMLPLFIFGLLCLVLMIASMLSLGLGLLVVIPMMVCGTYASYRQVFERPSPSIKLSK